MGFMWTAFDESSDKEQEHVFVVGGYLARQREWTEIERLWMARLEQEKDPHPMKYFSSNECMFLDGEFKRFRDPFKYPKPKGREAATKIREDLLGIMKNARAGGFALGLPLKTYRSMRKSARARRVLDADPFVHMYTMAMIIVAGKLEDEFKEGLFPIRETVAYLCDSHQKSADIKGLYDELKRQNPVCAQWMGSLTYMDNRLSPALQTADLLAAETKHVLATTFARETDASFRKKAQARLGGNVGVKYFDKKTLGMLVDANLLTNGKPSVYSTQQLKLETDAVLTGDKHQAESPR